jgi:hypothetical protein
MLGVLATLLVAGALPVAAQAKKTPVKAPVITRIVIKRAGKIVRVHSNKRSWKAAIAHMRAWDKRHHVKFTLKFKPKSKTSERAAVVTARWLKPRAGAFTTDSATQYPVQNEQAPIQDGQGNPVSCSLPFDGTGTLPSETSNDDSFFNNTFSSGNDQDAQSAGGFNSDVLTCSGQDTANVTAKSTEIDCTTYESGDNSQVSYGEYATFADGEYAGFCNNPAYANGEEPTPRQFSPIGQGFSCEAPVGVGSDGNTLVKVHGTDTAEAAEFYQYPNDLNPAFETFFSVTTVCVGTIPADATAPDTAVAHPLACYQSGATTDGFLTSSGFGSNFQGYGIEVTYPDGQYAETCNTPDYLDSGPDEA